MSELHARLSPSNLRWPKCPGSIREEAAYPDVAGEAAIDGTGSHLLLEKCLTEDVTPEFYDGKIIGANHHDKPSGWLVSQDRIERVQMCIDYINRRRKELLNDYPGSTVAVESESKSNPGAMHDRDDWHGTCDVTITAHSEEGDLLFLETIDYKDGRGWVNTKGNTQLIAYTGGKLIEAHRTGVHHPVSRETPTRMTIVQPKTNPPVRYEDQVADEVYKACDELAVAAAATDDPDAPLIAGKHCQWCKHKPNCTAQAEESMEVMMTNTSDVKVDGSSSLFEIMSDVIKDVSTVSSETLAELLDAKPGIDSLFESVEKEIESRLDQDPDSVTGYAMRPGRSSRKWALDDDEMAEVLKARRLKQAEIYPPKLISPAQAMKLDSLSDIQKERLEKEYIVKKEGSLRLTRVSGNTQKEPADLFSDVAQTKTNVVQLKQDDETPSFF